MTLILAIEPDRKQAAQLVALARNTLHAELVVADSTEEAFHRLGARVPDLVLTTALLSPKDEAALAEKLRVLDEAAAHVQLVTIPFLAVPSKRSSGGSGVLGRLRGKKKAAMPEGCDPAVFAEQITEYLQRAASERQAHAASTRAAAAPPVAPLPKTQAEIDPAFFAPDAVAAPPPEPEIIKDLHVIASLGIQEPHAQPEQPDESNRAPVVLPAPTVEIHIPLEINLSGLRLPPVEAPPREEPSELLTTRQVEPVAAPLESVVLPPPLVLPAETQETPGDQTPSSTAESFESHAFERMFPPTPPPPKWPEQITDAQREADAQRELEIARQLESIATKRPAPAPPLDQFAPVEAVMREPVTPFERSEPPAPAAAAPLFEQVADAAPIAQPESIPLPETFALPEPLAFPEQVTLPEEVALPKHVAPPEEAVISEPLAVPEPGAPVVEAEPIKTPEPVHAIDWKGGEIDLEAILAELEGKRGTELLDETLPALELDPAATLADLQLGTTGSILGDLKFPDAPAPAAASVAPPDAPSLEIDSPAPQFEQQSHLQASESPIELPPLDLMAVTVTPPEPEPPPAPEAETPAPRLEATQLPPESEVKLPEPATEVELPTYDPAAIERSRIEPLPAEPTAPARVAARPPAQSDPQPAPPAVTPVERQPVEAATIEPSRPATTPATVPERVAESRPRSEPVARAAVPPAAGNGAGKAQHDPAEPAGERKVAKGAHGTKSKKKRRDPAPAPPKAALPKPAPAPDPQPPVDDGTDWTRVVDDLRRAAERPMPAPPTRGNGNGAHAAAPKSDESRSNSTQPIRASDPIKANGDTVAPPVADSGIHVATGPLAERPRQAFESRKPSAHKGKKKTGSRKKAKPAQDEWGFFDPEQCGFAALLDKLDEVTEDDRPN